MNFIIQLHKNIPKIGFSLSHSWHLAILPSCFMILLNLILIFRYAVKRVLVVRTDTDELTDQLYDLDIILTGIKMSDVERDCDINISSISDKVVKSRKRKSGCEPLNKSKAKIQKSAIDQLLVSLETGSYEAIQSHLSKISEITDVKGVKKRQRKCKSKTGTCTSILGNMERNESTRSGERKFNQNMTNVEAEILDHRLNRMIPLEPGFETKPEIHCDSEQLFNQVEMNPVKDECDHEYSSEYYVEAGNSYSSQFIAPSVEPLEFMDTCSETSPISPSDNPSVPNVTHPAKQPSSKECGKKTKNPPFHFYEHKCMFCEHGQDGRDFGSWKALRAHILETHFTKDNNMYTLTCPSPDCDKTYVHPLKSAYKNFSLAQVLNHMYALHRIPFPTFMEVLKCPEPGCDYINVNWPLLNSHMKRRHQTSSTAGRASSQDKGEKDFGEQLVEHGASLAASLQLEKCDTKEEDDEKTDTGKLCREEQDGVDTFTSWLDHSPLSHSDIPIDSIDDDEDNVREPSSKESGRKTKNAPFHFYEHKCMFCEHGQDGRDFGSWKALRAHILETHFTKAKNTYTLTCPSPDCDKTYTHPLKSAYKNFSLAQVLNHMYALHRIPFPTFMEVLKCPEPGCDYINVNWPLLNKHMKRRHQTSSTAGRASSQDKGEKDSDEQRVEHGTSLAASLEKEEDDEKTDAGKLCREEQDGVDTFTSWLDHSPLSHSDIPMDSIDDDEDNVGDSRLPQIETDNIMRVEDIKQGNPGMDSQTEDTPGTYPDFPVDFEDLNDDHDNERSSELAQEGHSELDNTSAPVRGLGDGRKAPFPRFIQFHEYRCMFCPDEPDFKYWRKFRSHFATVHCTKVSNNTRFQFKCPQSKCPKKFISKFPWMKLPNILYHLHARHNIGIPLYIKVLHCPIPDCSFVQVNQSLINDHLKTKHGERPSVLCDQCGVCLTVNYVKYHKKYFCKATEQTRPDRLQCSYCPKRYNGPTALKVHIAQRHTNVQPPIICQFCSHRNKTEHEMDEHLYKAHGHNPRNLAVYRCSTCGYESMYPSKIKRHEIVVHSQQLFACTICGAEFNKVGKYMYSFFTLTFDLFVT